jgi:hypothetical protein
VTLHSTVITKIPIICHKNKVVRGIVRTESGIYILSVSNPFLCCILPALPSVRWRVVQKGTSA